MPINSQRMYIFFGIIGIGSVDDRRNLQETLMEIEKRTVGGTGAMSRQTCHGTTNHSHPMKITGEVWMGGQESSTDFNQKNQMIINRFDQFFNKLGSTQKVEQLDFQNMNSTVQFGDNNPIKTLGAPMKGAHSFKEIAPRVESGDVSMKKSIRTSKNSIPMSRNSKNSGKAGSRLGGEFSVQES
jgi:hypothetical protein